MADSAAGSALPAYHDAPGVTRPGERSSRARSGIVAPPGPEMDFVTGRIVRPASPRAGTPPARVAVIGAGAVGGYFAARAAATGAEVWLCVRRPFDRLVVVSTGQDGRDVEAEVPAEVVADPALLPTYGFDWVLLATKAHQVPAVTGWLRATVGPGTGVVVLQNGVRHAERVAAVARPDQVLPAVVYINAEAEGPGMIRHRAGGVIQVPDVPLAERLAERALTAGEVRLIDDFATAAWTKLCVNSAANTVTALTGRRLEVLRRDDVAHLALAIMAETVAVSAAEGAEIPEGLPEFTVRRLRGQPPGAGTSMLYDRLAGRRLEHEALIGAVVRIGAEHGIATPTCATVLPLLAAISDSPAG
ncbi:2-dehydropantoate 2-reductase [Frankia sp. CNm7]|uniref:2-dehydropantoate 2-reductase n=1 Tax=Frankia nepalensis TaxID=1836974 RepID=A0A937UQG3_9ACTN|nr:2-dehydropantoate 2-reductase [Frankia nepalensis]MBL7496411.1 2-dehydropantoate 2-reductase [Frankia nepalensis]MBL7513781.1 2-dehydropantoate 2-reductase [Frankia nepalensis]MBL7518639.1 2-dehydropantoate 2-reductase [Frankia nepalensis]MBL7630197.1 2-dehydropantoate 2-reductase [Frankia nepalensis]